VYRAHTVAAVVPAYNESGYVGDVVDGLPAFVDRAYIVDDGSTDDTWAEIREHAAERNAAHDGRFDDLVVPIQHEKNRGVGGAIKTGYLRAREEEIDLTVVLGGDDQMDPDELTRYLDPLVDGVADYAKGNRFSRPEDWAAMPRFRLLGNVVLSYLTKVASGYWATMDSQNGYTAISLTALEATDIEGMYEYYGYCNDLLVRLNVAGVTVADVPRSSQYAYQEGWKSHIDYTEYVPRVSAMLARGFLRRLRRKYLLQRYDPLAVLYPLGAGVAGVGLAGLAAALRRREGDGGSWFLSAVAGVLLFLYAGVRDRADNERLEVQVDPDSEASSDDGTAAGRPQPSTDGREAGNGRAASPPPTDVQSDGGTDAAEGDRNGERDA
jgi:glycosyltransferase involved in cell wall biosynthesis